MNKSFFYDLYILTTAIDRPDLHNQTLPPFFKTLKEQGVNYKWFINLDSPFKKTEEAVDNFKNFAGGVRIYIYQIKHVFIQPLNM